MCTLDKLLVLPILLSNTDSACVKRPYLARQENTEYRRAAKKVHISNEAAVGGHGTKNAQTAALNLTTLIMHCHCTSEVCTYAA